MDWVGCSQVGSNVSLNISNGLGGALMLLMFSNAPGNIKVGKCDLLVNPILGISGAFLNGSGPGFGTLSISGVIPPAAVNTNNAIQAWVVDPAVGIGAAATNGIGIRIIP